MPRKLLCPATVAQYFLDRLGAPLCDAEPNPPEHSPAHPDFHIGTGCEVDCKAAIDASAAMLGHVRRAYGTDRPDLIESVQQTCAEIVNCYVYG